jgi:hypothetical protein
MKSNGSEHEPGVTVLRTVLRSKSAVKAQSSPDKQNTRKSGHLE